MAIAQPLKPSRLIQAQVNRLLFGQPDQTFTDRETSDHEKLIRNHNKSLSELESHASMGYSADTCEMRPESTGG
jgi:hypothetical protein